MLSAEAANALAPEPPLDAASLAAADSRPEPPLDRASLTAADSRPEPPLDRASLAAADTRSEPPLDRASLTAADTRSEPPLDLASLAAADSLPEPPLDLASLAAADSLPEPPFDEPSQSAVGSQPEPPLGVALPSALDLPPEPSLARSVPKPEALDRPGESHEAFDPPPEPAFVASSPMTPIAFREEVKEIRAEPGGVFSQLGAWLVDAMVLGTIFAAYLVVAQMIAGKIPAATQTGIDWLVDRAIAWKGIILPGAAFLAALSFVYTSLFHALGGRTLGKRLFGLTVVDTTGMPPRLARSAARSLLAFVSAGLLMMGFVLVLFDSKRQALHDKLTRTFVVRLIS